MAEGWPKKRRLLGTKVKRLDGPEKSTGRAKYSYDINRPGMLHGVMLRSPHAHAKIKSHRHHPPRRRCPASRPLVVIGRRSDWLVVKADAGEHARTQEHPEQEEEGEGRDSGR